MSLGLNHRDDCDGTSSRISGEGYNRVRICACGAEDHEPDAASLGNLLDSLYEAYRALPPSPLTATFVQAVHEECHPFLASVLCRNESMRWRRYTGRRHKRRARYRRGREGVRPRLRGRR